MALIGQEAVRITSPWVQVSQAVTTAADFSHYDHGGMIVTGENREMKTEERPELYRIATPATSGGTTTVARVLSAFLAQGYEIAEHEGHVWLLQLVDASATEDVGDSHDVSVHPPASEQLFDRFQSWIDRRKQRRGG
jgi:hypothetical protein